MKFTITLNDYQIINLQAAIKAIGFPHEEGQEESPLSVLNNGDWLGELWYALPEDVGNIRANDFPEALKQKARDWKP